MKKLKAVLGITNKTSDDKYIPFLDFDNATLDAVIIETSIVSNTFNLSDYFIVTSTNGYNVFFLDKMSFNDCLNICLKCDSCDPNFIKYAHEKYNFTLRIGDDKLFYRHIETKNRIHELSHAHYLFFNQFFKADILNGIQTTDLNFDKLEEIQLVMYMSKKYGYIEVD